MAAPLPSAMPATTNGALPASLTGKAIVKDGISSLEEAKTQVIAEANGATVHSFDDPKLSPSEKAAQIKSSAPNPLAGVNLVPLPILSPPDAPIRTGGELKDGKSFREDGGRELMSDVGTAAAGGGVGLGVTEGLPTVTSSSITTSKAEKKLDENSESTTGSPKVEEVHDEVGLEQKEKEVPGALPAVKVREIPDWFSIGWTGQDKTLFETPEEVRTKNIVSDFLSDIYYGQWYHNAAIIIFAVVSSHFITLLGGGWAWLIIVVAFCATYYSTSIMRTRRNVRDDMMREVEKKGLKSDVESAAWLNLFMTRFWLIYEPVLSATIVASVDQVLSVSTPAFLDSIRMTTFTLGTKPPRIDHVRTFADTEDDVVMMEWAISFTPNDVQDMTYAAASRKVNPKIVLNIRLGVGPAVVGKDIIVEDISFTGTMRIKMKLMNNFPHVQLVDLSFMQPPVFDFVLKPIGFDLSIIPGLTPFINSQVHATLGPMMYEPNTFTLNLEQMLSGAPIDTACGVLAITIYNGKGFKGTKLGGGSPDPYVSIAIDGRAEVAKTAIKKSTTNPRWNETKYILLNNLNDMLSLNIKDWNEHRPDSDLGIVHFDLKSLLEDGQQENKLLDVILDGKPRGQLKIDAIYFPVLTPKKLVDGTLDVIPETKCGVVRLVIHQAKELDPRGQQINPYVNVSLNDRLVHRTQTLKRTPSPIWERPTEFLVTEKSNATITLNILDENSLVNDTSLGIVKVKLTDLLDAKAKEIDWYPVSGARTGRLRVTAEWKPVLMAGAHSGADAYTPPIGVVKIWFKRARDLKNVEALTGGKSDPYVRVLNAGIVLARSLIVNNNLDPEWDEIVYVPVHGPKDQFVVEVMDYQHLTKDRSLGVTELRIADLLVPGTDKKLKPWESTGRHERKEPLQIDGKKVVKGNIEFEVTFVPCAHLKNVSFTEPVSDAIAEGDESESMTNSSRPSTPQSPLSTKAPTFGSPISLAATSNGRPSTADSTQTSPPASKVDPNEGIVIPRAELLKAQSGILAFQIMSGLLTKKGARLEVLFDDGYWPTYSTEHARSPKAVWDEIGEAFIRELDYAQVILKLNMAEKDTREEIIGTTTIDLNAFLETCLDKPGTFTLTDPSGNRSTVVIAAKYIPVDIVLEPRESVNNSGVVRVDLLDAKNIPAADRSGKSDPYVVFELNGVKVFKSEVQKKTLSPVWNENFDVPVLSRVAAKFIVHVYDWDRVGSATKLGSGVIDVAALEPIESSGLQITLDDVVHNKPGAGGTLRLRLLFRPQFLARTRQSTSTFSSAGRIATGLGGGVVGAGGHALGSGAHGVGVVGKMGLGGVGAVGKGVFGGVRRLGGGSSHSSNPSDDGSDVPPVPALPANAADMSGLATVPSMASMNGSFAGSPLSQSTNGTGYTVESNAGDVSVPTPKAPSTQGNLSVTIVELKGLEGVDDKRIVTLKAGKTTVATTHALKGDPAHFDETFQVKTVDGEACKLELTVLHKKRIGSDTVLGTASFNAFDHISPLSPTATFAASVAGSTAQLTIGLSWAQSRNPSGSSGVNDDARSTKSLSSKKRFSLAR